MVGGFADGTSGMKFGFVGQNGTAFVRALESKADTKVLSAPRLLVLNKQSAEVQLGKQLGFQNPRPRRRRARRHSFQQIPIGTVLDIRPYISSDGMIRMEVHPQRATGDIDDNRTSPDVHRTGLDQRDDSRRNHDGDRRIDR